MKNTSVLHLYIIFQSNMMRQLPNNFQEEYFLNLMNIFQSDEMFAKLMQALSDHRKYFAGGISDSKLKEIVWWLYRTNVSCFKSGLITVESFEAFAEFILLKHCSEEYIKK